MGSAHQRSRLRWRQPLLLLAVLLGLAFRVVALDTYGFSEDESAKLRAIDAYRRGDFTANAEHPMLMKLSMWASLSAADAWNGLAPAALAVAPETALRLPNAVAGTATLAAVSGLAAVLFGWPVGLMAAFLVALDPNVTAVNRIGKEDTFLMLFLLLAMYLYERAKVVGTTDPDRAQRWYAASGASFGLMLGSKYMPHFFGIYALFNAAAVWNAGRNAPRKGPYYGVMLAAFLAVNFAVLLPETWWYCLEYARGEHVPHHGYMYDGALYGNSTTSFVAHGVPATYYLQLLATKVPLPVLAAGAVGAVPLVRKHRERGFIWIRVFLVFTLLGYSLFGSKFQRYALPMMIVLDVLAAAGVATAFDWIWRQDWTRRTRLGLCVAAGVTLAALLLTVQVRAVPFFSAHQNLFGAALAPPVTTFPEEAYDYGVREAVREIAAAAGPGAAIVSDAPMVVEQYLARANRPDLEARSLSQDGLPMRGEQWVLVQDSHIYFENESLVAQLRQRETPWREYRIRGTVVLQVFRIVR